MIYSCSVVSLLEWGAVSFVWCFPGKAINAECLGKRAIQAYLMTAFLEDWHLLEEGECQQNHRSQCDASVWCFPSGVASRASPFER